MSIINTIKTSIREAATEMKLIKSSNKTAQERAKELAEANALKEVLEHDLEQAERKERAKSILAGQQKELDAAEAHVKKLTDDKKVADKLGALATEQLKTLIDTLESIGKLDSTYHVGTYEFAKVFRNIATSDKVKQAVPSQTLASMSMVDKTANAKEFGLTGGNDIKRAAYLRDEAKKALDNSAENIDELIDEQIQNEQPRDQLNVKPVRVQAVDMRQGTSERVSMVNQTLGGE